MANVQQIKEKSLAIIDSAITIVNKYPAIDTANSELSFNSSTNPFTYLMDAFKHTAGYEIVIQILSNFIMIGLPALELSVKGVLLANIKNILSCSINPFISEELLRDGIVFNLEQIDISDTLRYCPTSKNGQYYYFDIKNKVTYEDGKTSRPTIYDTGGVFKTADELKDSKDLNCLLWYMKNRASFREVWGKKKTQNTSFINDSDYWNADKNKCRKGAGIITLEYNERSEGVKNAEGNGMNLQTPYNNCIHVFIGNTKECDTINHRVFYVTTNKDGKSVVIVDGEEYKLSADGKSVTIDGTPYKVENNRIEMGGGSVSGLNQAMAERSLTIQTNQAEIERILKELNKLQKKSDKAYKLYQKGKITVEDYENNYYDTQISECISLIRSLQSGSITFEEYDTRKGKKIPVFENGETTYKARFKSDLINELNRVKDYQKKCNEAITQKVNIIKEQHNTDLQYRPIQQNYYYGHTLLEFNTDYVMSLRLFDAKVVTAQLIDSLTSLLTIDLDFSWKQQYIKSEIEKMIKMIVETDSTVVDDCFFTFTNEAYDAMLQKAELNRMGLFSANGEENTATVLNPEELLEKLNNIDETAIQSGDSTIIEHALTEISRTVAEEGEGETKNSLNFGVQMNFIENLMNNLAYVITSAVLSPKVYLIILINLQILGKNTNFDIKEFIGNYKQLIANILRDIRDSLMKYLVDELTKLLGRISVDVAVKIGIEQMEYYKRLLTSVLECFKRSGGNGLDFTIDDVRADILSEEVTEKKKEC